MDSSTFRIRDREAMDLLHLPGKDDICGSQFNTLHIRDEIIYAEQFQNHEFRNFITALFIPTSQ